MNAIAKSVVDKVLPEAEKLLKEQGVVALAKALILSTKTENMYGDQSHENKKIL